MTSLLLRADAAPSMGVGHLSRCVALATAARSRGWDVALCGSFTAGQWLIGTLPVVSDPEPADAVLVDHYGIGEFAADGLVVSIEDGTFGRRRADVVVDANLYEVPRQDDGSPVVLRGPAYAPLRAEIRAARAARRGGSVPPRVVVVMGGGAAPSSVAAALTALRDTGVPSEVVAISAAPVPGFDVTPPTPDVPALFASADLVVSAAGVTLMELCCIGVPTALVRIADNQAAGYEAAVGRGLAAGLGTDPREHVPALRALLLDSAARHAMGERARTTVDGRGADRILDAMGFDPTVRPATEADAASLLSWRNDAETRRWSRTSDPVSPVEHKAWLARVLADPARLLYVAEHDGRPVGTVRFDRDGPVWEVSITVAPEARGRRLAVPMLLAAERALGPGVIRANVHRDNGASLALFRRGGYRVAVDGEWLWLEKSPSQE
ncbi:MAG: bifunctional UDP-2,4-diacetamido-2,4,6-trideoxy-beta-L-altropyranose hydrolase/GNAT family N-acetyltransferase [Actinophytocola sp.]|uniref:GNAT family N-acetyltransferase n=1 Tax=Actinophytocola sp. TaxID=1872138 RepID=UPI003C785595